MAASVVESPLRSPPSIRRSLGREASLWPILEHRSLAPEAIIHLFDDPSPLLFVYG